MSAVVHDQNSFELRELCGNPELYGHNGVHDALAELCARWSVGLDALAEDERVGTAMTIVEVEQYGLFAIDEGDHPAGYRAGDWLRSSRPANAAPSSSIRLNVEVLRRLGGLTPRALLGGQFAPGQGRETQFAVAVATFGLFDADEEPTCPSVLWKQPFTIGLPSEFASAIADALGAGPELPAGTLTIDRAGFDLVNSSELIFSQAAAVLKAAVAAVLSGQEPGAAARSLVTTW